MVPQTAGYSVTGPETLLDDATIQPSPPLTDSASLVAGRYLLLRPLGAGGMGNVYLADDTLLARRVAVKTIRPELTGNEEVRSRIKRESRMHAAIGTHPNIITLYDTIEENGHIYLVLEYFEAETLSQLLLRHNPLPLHKALAIIRQVLLALSCIHQRDIVHRDIKTSNILLQEQDDGTYLAKLMDFGIARAEIDHGAMTRLTCLDTRGPGTPAYMAPERIDPQTFGRMSPATDLYAVGIILFELLAGKPPFSGTMTDIFTGHLMHPPDLSGLAASRSASVTMVLDKALAKRPADRFAHAASFLEALASLGAGAEQVAQEPYTVHEDATRLATEEDRLPASPSDATVLIPGANPKLTASLLVTRHRWKVAAAGLAVVLLVTLVVRLQTASWGEPDAAPDTAMQPAPSPKPETVAQINSAGKEDAGPDESTALQVVEKARADEAGSAAGTDKTNESQQESQGWRILESQSRRIN